MNYIYDILLNFNSEIYDFYDWNEDDKITHIRKIPLYKINANEFKSIINNKIKLDKNILKQIKDKTEVFQNHKVTTLEYSCLFSNGIETIAIIFNKDGIAHKYSNLLLDENDEVIEVCEKLVYTKIKLKLLDSNNKYLYLTRKDISIIKYINKEILKIRRYKNIDKLQYLYYELFNKKSYDFEQMINMIKQQLNNINGDDYKKIYNLFKLTSLKK